MIWRIGKIEFNAFRVNFKDIRENFQNASKLFPVRRHGRCIVDKKYLLAVSSH
jgi:hypothetical protein